MRTKTLLLSATALIAGVVASQAQSNVFSANIVGYVSVTNPAGPFVLWANPLDNGTNNLSGLVPGAPNGSSVYVFSGGNLVLANKAKGVWDHDFIIPPGTGFFYSAPFVGTNTFVGNVAGFSNAIPLQAGITVLAGSPIPFSGQLSDQGTNTINLNSLPNGSTVNYFDSTGALVAANKAKGVWDHNPTIPVGIGFYVNSPLTTNIVQILNLQ